MNEWSYTSSEEILVVRNLTLFVHDKVNDQTTEGLYPSVPAHSGSFLKWASSVAVTNGVKQVISKGEHTHLANSFHFVIWDNLHCKIWSFYEVLELKKLFRKLFIKIKKCFILMGLKVWSLSNCWFIGWFETLQLS